MFITLAAYKGGVGKTTTAMHLAAHAARSGKTVLIDADPNRSALTWAARGQLPFDVFDTNSINQIYAGKYAHTILDTAARPTPETIKSLAEGCDTLILPSSPDLLSLDALLLTVRALQEHGAKQFKILLTMVRPKPARDGDVAHARLREAGLPIFDGMIRRYQSFVTAAATGSLVGDVRDERATFGAADYEAIAKEIGL